MVRLTISQSSRPFQQIRRQGVSPIYAGMLAELIPPLEAHMPTARGITCSLRIDGQATTTPEYDTQTEDLNDFVSTFIVAEEGKRFSLEVSATERTLKLASRVYIDGVYQDSAYHSSLANRACFNSKMEYDRVTKQWFKKAWKFDKLALVDEKTSNCVKDPQVLSSLGTIELVFIRCRRFNLQNTPPLQTLGWQDPHPYSKPHWGLPVSQERDSATAASRPRPVFEKDIKGRGISHAISMGPEGRIERPPPVIITQIDTWENPYCIFFIRYRSREALENMGLIRATPIPSPKPEAPAAAIEEIQALSREDMVKELLKYRIQESRKMKKEEPDSDEEGVVPRKKPRMSGEKVVIDLTDD